VGELGAELPTGEIRLIVVTDPVLGAGKQTTAVTEALKDREVIVFAEVEPNPCFETVDRGAELAREFGANLIVGLGGGSPMDAAKGVAALSTNPDLSTAELVCAEALDNPPLPVVCIPTTSGTGSEVTPFAVFSDHKNKAKVGCSFHEFFPELAIVDPQMTYSMPERVVIDTGLDVLTHALEAFLSTVASPMSDVFALEAIRYALEFLPAAKAKDHEAMDAMAFASTLAGAAITHGGTILPHVMGYPLTVFHDIPHGRASMLVGLPFLEWLKHSSPENPKVQMLEHLLGGFSALRSLLESLDVETDLAHYGVSTAEIDQFVPRVMVKSDLQITPAEIRDDDVRSIYQMALG
jgi:alcohol dehydrogenase class IV